MTSRAFPVCVIAVLAALLCSLVERPACADFLPRRGYVTLQFDDSHDLHYYYIYPILESHGFKGTFAVITETSDLGIENSLAWAVREMYLAGHEIHDHTTRHDHMWATLVDTLDDGITEWIPYTFANVATWDSLCERSLFILDSLGVEITGWNQPGGTKPGKVPGHPEWRTASRVNDSLYAVIGAKYEYAMGNWGTHWFNAHPNLRGHNCPDRFPFFNVPHVMIDNLTMDEIKTGIADAVASGLWYCAVDHAYTMDEVARIETLAAWLDSTDVEIVRCCEGRERIQFGYCNPLENQLPQARMLTDLDGNGKPDGFAGQCSWDTTTSPPIDSCRCCRIYGDTDWICYGPEVGANAFSIWARSTDTTDVTFGIAHGEYDFDWGVLGGRVIGVQCSGEWTRIDTSDNYRFLIDIEDEVDRVLFRVQGLDEGDTILVSYPEFNLVGEAGIRVQRAGPGPRPAAAPNPARLGDNLLVTPSYEVYVYDVLGRELMHIIPSIEREGLLIDTSRLGPGVFFIGYAHGGHAAKVVVLH